MDSRPLSDLILLQSDYITINDNLEYTRVTAKLHRKGIVLRDKIKGENIKTKRQQVCRANQLLVAEIDAKVGGYGIVPRDLEGAIVSSHYFLFDIDEEKLSPEYLKYVIGTDEFFSQIKAQGSTNYASIRPKDVLKINIPYCNLEKQRKISKSLEKIFAKKEHILNNLSIEKESISRLRETILQEAISGKLVSHDKADEPASILLQKIKLEKEEAIRQKEVKQEKTLPPISKEEIPYQLPEGWVWVRWRDITKWITYGFTRPMPHLDQGIPIITAKNIGIGTVSLFNVDNTSEEAFSSLNSKDIPLEGDILLTKDGSIGRCAVVTKDLGKVCISQSVAVLWLRGLTICREYLLLAIEAPLTQEKILEKTQGVAVPHISITHFGKMLVPIPPLKEQFRIVKKVNELLALCSEFEVRIAEINRYSAHFAEMVACEKFRL